VLHGGTPIGKRKDIVARFQDDEYVPYMVLSLKAGGVGLNLTAANHVIHFDRWWNPAVENQATDRAFRIGQKKNVLVHKFITKGTVEEKIDDMIEGKMKLSKEVIQEGGEKWITELSNEALMKVFSLTI
jgi:non-specific serine/threonine protein kinase